jgi:DNA-binding transcriptional LysR family regulator
VNVNDIDLNLLRVFDAVLRERGVTPAASRLGLTQPAVSNALARLRALFGDALFVRTPAGMDATPFARGVAEPMRQALALLESALAHGPGYLLAGGNGELDDDSSSGGTSEPPPADEG